MSLLEEAYRTLELRPGASMDDIKQAYRRLAREWHPDLYPYGPELRRRCEAKMARINEAYGQLRDFASASAETVEDAEAEPLWEEEPVAEPPPGAPDAPGTAGSGTGPPEPEPEPQAPPEAEPWLEPRRERPGKRPPPGWDPFRWNVPRDEPDYPGLLRVGAVFAGAALILLYFFVRAPYYERHFLTIRAAASLAALYAAAFGFRRGYWEFAIGLIMVLFISNPLLPVSMGEGEWRVFTLALPLLLAYIWLEFYRREAGRR